MLDEKLKFGCEYRPWSDHYAFYIACKGETYSLAKALLFEKAPIGAVPEPVMTLQNSEAQEMIDALWSAGLRPTLGKQSEGVTAAQANHLADMRRIAFAKLNVPEPEGK